MRSMNLGLRLFFLFCVIGGLKGADTELEVVMMVSSAAEFNTSGVIPAVDLALQTINNWSLPFHLSYNTILDSQV